MGQRWRVRQGCREGSEKHQSTEWVVKVASDAVKCIAEHVPGQMVPASGVYLANCPFVDDGYVGNLETFSVCCFPLLVIEQAMDCGLRPLLIKASCMMGIRHSHCTPSPHLEAILGHLGALLGPS